MLIFAFFHNLLYNMFGDSYMKKKRLCFFVFLFVLLIFVIYGYFVVVNRKVEEERLFLAIDKIGETSLLEDEIVSYDGSNGYQEVYDGVESYLRSFREQYQKVMSYADNSKLMTMLSVSNYSEDGPLFENSLSYLDNLSEEFSSDVDFLLSYCEESKIEEYASHLKLSNYYRELFIDYVKSSKVFEQLSNYRDTFLQSEEEMNSVISTSRSVLEFLKTNGNDWKIENGEIQFSTEELVTQYQNLVDLLL